MAYTLILLRHGHSEWNEKNLFTGWVDVDLSGKGVAEGKRAGELLADAGLAPDILYTSLLKRAIKTADLALEGADRLWIPVKRSWRLNERHYGALQGLNKAQTAQKYGDEQVKLWRRSFDVRPPCLAEDDPRYPGREECYKHLDKTLLPLAESLRDTSQRTLPCWNELIAPAVKSGQKVLITAHGNSLRSLVKYLDNINDDEILKLDIPTGIPLVYELDDELRPLRHYYLTDGNQGKARGKMRRQ